MADFYINSTATVEVVRESKLTNATGATAEIWEATIKVTDNKQTTTHNLVIKRAKPGKNQFLEQEIDILEWLNKYQGEREAAPKCIVQYYGHRTNSAGLIEIFLENLQGFVPLGNAMGMLSKVENVAKRSRFVKDIDAAFNHLKERSVVHADGTPENFMVREADGQGKLIDFGQAQIGPGPATDRTNFKGFLKQMGLGDITLADAAK